MDYKIEAKLALILWGWTLKLGLQERGSGVSFPLEIGALVENVSLFPQHSAGCSVLTGKPSKSYLLSEALAGGAQ